VVRYEQVQVRLEDNFDTAGAVSELLLLVKDVHSYIDKCNSMSVKPRIFIIQKAALYITKILSIFGLSDAGRGDIGFGSSASQGVASAASLEVVVVCMGNPVSPLAQLVFIGTGAL
jgi:cysteinyl-tRNA synthetase